MSQVIPQQEDINKAWKYYEHADNLYANRVYFFLVAESMVVVAYVTLDAKQWFLRLLIAILGVIYTYIWFDVNLRLANRMTFLDENFLTYDKIYQRYMESVPKRPSSRRWLTYGLPIPTGIFWSLLLGHASHIWWLCVIFPLLWIPLVWGLWNHYRKYNALQVEEKDA